MRLRILQLTKVRTNSPPLQIFQQENAGESEKSSTDGENVPDFPKDFKVFKVVKVLKVVKEKERPVKVALLS